jgi:hypothetical protein
VLNRPASVTRRTTPSRTRASGPSIPQGPHPREIRSVDRSVVGPTRRYQKESPRRDPS